MSPDYLARGVAWLAMATFSAGWFKIVGYALSIGNIVIACGEWIRRRLEPTS